MGQNVSPIPEGFHTVTPHLTVKDCDKTIEFYKKAFNAEVIAVSHDPSGRVMHGDIKIGDSIVMLHDEYPEWGKLSPVNSNGATPATLHIYTEDAKRLWDQAIAAGAKEKMALQNMFWGDLYGEVADPSRHIWAIAQRTATLSREEIAEAAKKAFSATPGA